jgi:trimeric autotransporter adhesin
VFEYPEERGQSSKPLCEKQLALRAAAAGFTAHQISRSLKPRRVKQLALGILLSITLANCGENESLTPQDCTLAGGGDGNDILSCQPECGDGERAVGELCDDGNLISGDGCDSNCTLTSCGNGISTAGESCDDGNAANGDGCDENCTLSECGNGVVAFKEMCDDGNAVDGDACSNDCIARPRAYLKASNTNAEDWFGFSIALSADGSTLAIGAPFEDSAAIGIEGNQTDDSRYGAGAVYVFTRSGMTWLQQAYIKASNTDWQDLFGYSLTLSADGSTLAVGAPWEDSSTRRVDGAQTNNSAEDAGAVYIFTRSGTRWSQQSYIKASNAGAGDTFGHSVSLSSDGSTLVVGAPWENSAAIGVDGDQDDNSASNAGALYVFLRQGLSWSQQAYIKASNTGTEDLFGYSVAISSDGETIAASAVNEDGSATGIDQGDNSATDAGAVYVFRRRGAVWRQRAYLKPSISVANAQFGTSIALAGDGSTIAVGAPREDDAVYIFAHEGETWNQQSYIKAPSDVHYFGWSIGLSSDGATLAVGAWDENGATTDGGGPQANESAPFSGAVYKFRLEDKRWTPKAYIKALNTEAEDLFGWNVALSSDGSTLAASARDEDSAASGTNNDQSDNSAMDAGAVYVYY